MDGDSQHTNKKLIPNAKYIFDVNIKSLNNKLILNAIKPGIYGRLSRDSLNTGTEMKCEIHLKNNNKI